MNRLSLERQVEIIGALVEGNSIRATCRLTGTAKGTVTRLLQSVGFACASYQDKALRELTCRRLHCDEIWSFCYAKEESVPPEGEGRSGYGDVWTWTSIDTDSRLVPAWLVGLRDAGYALEFMSDLAARLVHRVQLTTDGHKPYLTAVENAFRTNIDYAMLVKLYGAPLESEKPYSPSECQGTRTHIVMGDPKRKPSSTSYAERHSLTMRMSMRRFTRLTRAFSRRIENLEHAVALNFMWYNFGRVHGSLKTTPANAAGVDPHCWTLQEIAALAGSN